MPYYDIEGLKNSPLYKEKLLDKLAIIARQNGQDIPGYIDSEMMQQLTAQLNNSNMNSRPTPAPTPMMYGTTYAGLSNPIGMTLPMANNFARTSAQQRKNLPTQPKPEQWLIPMDELWEILMNWQALSAAVLAPSKQD